MSSDVKSGYFFVADITGYTKFLAETELEHAKGILEDLFDAILPTLTTPVKISGLRGDAVFCYAIDDDITGQQFMLDIAEKIYGAFAEKKDRIRINTACSCTACAHMEDLDLKVFIHHGDFVVQKSGDTEELAGTAVNTLFRLTKNNVVETTGIEAYALITCDAVNRMGIGDFFPPESFHTETYEHIGDVEFIVHDLKKSWEQRRDAKRIYVADNDAQLVEEATISVPLAPEAAFVMTSRPDLRLHIVEADDIQTINKKGKVINNGTMYHCHHGNDVILFEILDWRPGEYMTGVYQLPMGMTLLETTDFVPYGEGTLIKIRYGELKADKWLGRLMAKLLKSKMKSLFGSVGEKCSRTIPALATELLKTNPEIAALNAGNENVIDISEAVAMKMAG